jgi:AraC family transcriptional regulator, melibiose operon regulatory protein
MKLRPKGDFDTQRGFELQGFVREPSNATRWQHRVAGGMEPLTMAPGPAPGSVAEKTCANKGAPPPSDLLGVRCWREPGGGAPVTHDGIEVEVLERAQAPDVHRDNVVHIRPLKVAVFWAAFPHQPMERTGTGRGTDRLHRLALPLTLFLSRDLPQRLVVGVLAGRLLSADLLTRSRTLGNFEQWEEDFAGGTLEMRRAAVSEVDAWLRRIAPELSSDGDITEPEPVTGLSPARSVDVAATMCQYIVTTFREPVQVADVARAARVNPQHAMALFREAFGCTIVEYLTRCRVSEAQRLLIGTEATTSDVAFASGFGSVSHFYERFTSTCGQTPRQYRLGMRSS